MVKHLLLKGIRKTGLIRASDWLYFQWHRIRYYHRNSVFRKKHPHMAFPPPYMLYESYRLDYEAYITDGKNAAAWLKQILSEYIPTTGIRMLEWGCGPARIVRHIPLTFEGCHVFATDYNPHTIAWCKKHIYNVDFSINDLQPPLPYPADFFDVVYALSVFTHLSEKHHYDWLSEMHRVLKLQGVLLLTTQGEAFKVGLFAGEKDQFNNGNVVVREGMTEGHRSYSAFQPEAFMTKLFSAGWEVLKWMKGSRQKWGIEQDTWMVRKKPSSPSEGGE